MVQEKPLILYGLTREELEERFYLCDKSESGLRWRKTVSATAVRDSVAGCYSMTEDFPCWRTKVNKRAAVVSRVIWFLWKNELPEIIDHIDGNPKNNSLNNLRNTTTKVNNENRVLKNENEVAGVYLREDKYGNTLWRCQGTAAGGLRWSKVFATKKFGFDRARELCIEYRRNKEKENDTQTREVSKSGL